MGTKPERWIPGLNNSHRSSAIRLFCFPFAGGGASTYNRWAERERKTFQVWAVQYPGRETRWGEQSFANLPDMVDAIAEDLSPLWEGQFAFWGHSFGGLVAFELSKTLLCRGSQVPERLFISAARAPHLPAREPIHHLPDTEFLRKLCEFEGMSEEVMKSPDLLSVVLPIIRDDFRLFETHHACKIEPLPVPISVFGGLQDTGAPIGDLLAWSSYTTNTFRSRFFPGNHFFAFDVETGGQLARCMAEDLQLAGKKTHAHAPGKGVLVNE
jgi:medium-chain acyl-[acyl-carrier-protein] hydrolase